MQNNGTAAAKRQRCAAKDGKGLTAVGRKSTLFYSELFDTRTVEERVFALKKTVLPVPPRLPDGRPVEPPKVIPAQMRRVGNLIHRYQNELCREEGIEDVTMMHGWILGYLRHRAGQDVYQRDIERAFSITRSTVTNILQLMEKKGYIRRESVPQDARLKRLVATEQGVEIHDRIMSIFHRTDAHLESLLTPEENAELLRILEKLRTGLER